MVYKTVNPYTNELVKEYANVTDAQMEAALVQAYNRYQAWRRDNNLVQRKMQLHRVADLLRRDCDHYAQVITTDMGKLFSEAQGEVLLCADIADYFADKAEEFLAPQPLKTEKGEAYYLKQASGVIFAIEPWNFPFYQVMRVFAPNFMIGNPMLLKHASICPGSAQAFQDLINEAEIEAGAFTNLFASYDQVATAIADRRVSGVCLTGSERGGAAIAKIAGENLKKSSLELGGNDAFIILDDADMDEVAQVITPARLYNAGQVCTSSKRFIVTEKNYQRFVDDVVASFKMAKWGDPMDETTVVAPLSSAKAKKDVLAQIALAVENGAQVAFGNQAINHLGNFVMPTVLTDITKDNPLYNTEVFGPVAEIYCVKDEEAAIALANDSSYGLGGTVFSMNLDHAKAVAAKIETGMSFINSGWTSLPELPFGGIKNSGYGRELSQLGFNTFINEHLVFKPYQ